MGPARPDAPFPGASSPKRGAGVTRATASPELPRHLPGAGKTRSKVNRSRSAAGAGLRAQRRGRAVRTEVRTSGCLAPPSACRAPRRRSRRPPAPPPAATAAVGPIYGSAAVGSGRLGRRSRVPAPVLTFAARAALRSFCKLSREARTPPSSGWRAPAGRARGPGRRRAGRALTWLAGQRLLLAPPQERNSRQELEGAGRATSRSGRTAEVTSLPLLCPPHPVSPARR